MTKRLESLFDLPTASEPVTIPKLTVEETKFALAEIDQTIDKIDAALPGIRDLDRSDSDLDELASKATESFDNLMDLGMNVDSRYASEIFAVAGAMLGHAITAKTAKMNKKLKMIDLQLRKAKLDQSSSAEENIPTAQGMVLDRNDLLNRLLNRGNPDAAKN